MGFTFEIKGMEAVQRAIKQTPTEAKKAIRGVLSHYVTMINGEQVRNAQRFTDRGQLIKGIGWDEVSNLDELNFTLFSQAPHSAYLEFGTGKKFQAIAEVNASAYQGAGGSTGKMFDKILAWVKRKGIAGSYATGIVKRGKKSGGFYSIDPTKKKGRRVGGKATRDKEDRRAAWAIMRSLLVNGIKPQPFFFTPFLSKREQIKSAVEQALNNL